MALINGRLLGAKMVGRDRSETQEITDLMAREDQERKEKRIDLPGIKSSVATVLDIMTNPVSRDRLVFGEQDVHSPLIVLRNNIRYTNGEKYMFGVVFGLEWRNLYDGRTSADKLSSALDTQEESIRDIKSMAIYGFDMPFDPKQEVGREVVDGEVSDEAQQHTAIPIGINVARMIDYSMDYNSHIAGYELKVRRKEVSEFGKLASATLDVIVNPTQAIADMVNWVP